MMDIIKEFLMCCIDMEVLFMSAFNQTRFKNLEQSLKEGYVQMADLNLSLATEAYPVECEACDCNESHLTTDYKED